MLYFPMPILKMQHMIQICKGEIMIKLIEITLNFRKMVGVFQ